MALRGGQMEAPLALFTRRSGRLCWQVDPAGRTLTRPQTASGSFIALFAAC